MSSETTNLSRIAIRGGAFMGFSQAVKVGSQFLSVILLARLLTPEDFGLVASVGPIIVFISLFQDLGLQQALVQKDKLDNLQISDVFWASTAAGVICSIIVVLISPLVASFYSDPRLIAVTSASAIPLLIGSLCSIPLSILNRNLRFRTLATIEVISIAVGLITALASAIIGMRYWSLLISTSASSLTTLVASWVSSRYTPMKPRFRMDREIISFGAGLTGFNFLNFFSRNLDNVLIGKFHGSVELGYYDRAYKLMVFPLQTISGPLSRIMIPILSRFQTNQVKFREIYLFSAQILCFVAVPGLASLVIISDTFVDILFGERWAPIAPVFFWLGLAGLLQPLGNSTGWVFISLGRTKAMFYWGIYSSIVTVGSILVGLQGGSVGVASAYALSSYLLKEPVLYFILGRKGPIFLADYWLIQGPLLASAGLSWFFVHFGFQEALSLAGFPLILMTLLTCYLLSLLSMLSHARGRKTLAKAIGMILRSSIQPSSTHPQ
ncbi:lipopolysaccharide biosynthesis protein [Microvirga terrae]|uniref:Lipopolysaccharide biosynthesis protein n=1 Tax=Microvirga terrae TaxID=2740529 RepID=A0ABY5RR24_9HYPH|nr:lipopolysaccharide biosynthesis protein [Microvirga terrae]UVF18399.1 lipopolysaccharide biosynthesis protein [Microvirga terrae]